MKECSTVPPEFTGFILGKNEDGDVVIDQNNYLRNLECLRNEAYARNSDQ